MVVVASKPVSPSLVGAGPLSRSLEEGLRKTKHKCEFGVLTQYNSALKDKGRDKLCDNLLGPAQGRMGQATEDKKPAA